MATVQERGNLPGTGGGPGAGRLRDEVEYGPYGRSRRFAQGDFDRDGAVQTAVDIFAFLSAAQANPPSPAGDEDDNGSVSVVTDLFAWLGEANTGDSSPRQLVSAYTVDNPYGYCGYYQDAETGAARVLGPSRKHASAAADTEIDGPGCLYSVRFRVYDPFQGRWLTRDPAGFVDGMNLYQYCMGGPVGSADPMGLMGERGWGILKAVGGALEVAAGVALGATAGWTGIGAVAAAAIIAHGIDTAASGVAQAAYGVEVSTLTSDAVAVAARAAGASDQTAHAIGDSVDAALSLVTIVINPANGASGGLRFIIEVRQGVATTAGVVQGGRSVEVVIRGRQVIGVAATVMHAVVNTGQAVTGSGNAGGTAPPTSGETPATARGRRVHKDWDPGPGYQENFRLPSGKRPDAVDWENARVNELKPNNPREILRGRRQLEEYRRELESIDPQRRKWTTELETYNICNK